MLEACTYCSLPSGTNIRNSSQHRREPELPFPWQGGISSQIQPAPWITAQCLINAAGQTSARHLLPNDPTNKSHQSDENLCFRGCWIMQEHSFFLAQKPVQLWVNFGTMFTRLLVGTYTSMCNSCSSTQAIAQDKHCNRCSPQTESHMFRCTHEARLCHSARMSNANNMKYSSESTQDSGNRPLVSRVGLGTSSTCCCVH